MVKNLIFILQVLFTLWQIVTDCLTCYRAAKSLWRVSKRFGTLSFPDKVSDMKSELFGDRIFLKVKNHMGWDTEKTALWFRTKNPHFGEMSPSDYLLMRPDKIEKIIDALIAGLWM